MGYVVHQSRTSWAREDEVDAPPVPLRPGQPARRKVVVGQLLSMLSFFWEGQTQSTSETATEQSIFGSPAGPARAIGSSSQAFT